MQQRITAFVAADAAFGKHPEPAAVLGAGLFPAVVWCNRVAEPLSTERSVHIAFAAAFVTSIGCAVAFASGGRIRRWVASITLFAAVGGTLLADPTRHLIATWIVGA